MHCITMYNAVVIFIDIYIWYKFFYQIFVSYLYQINITVIFVSEMTKETGGITRWYTKVHDCTFN